MKVGIFDSGVGGLTVLSAIREYFPNVDLCYLGDTARVPYGTKSPDTVVRYSLECADFLMDKGIDVLVVACNTASSYALEVLYNHVDVPVIGVVKPGVHKALRLTKGRVGVIGTSATIKSDAYRRELEKHKVAVFQKACPLFVPLVEEGIIQGDIADRVVEMYLSELKSKRIDTLILGCTHYPLLKGAIQNFMGDSVAVIDSSDAVAEELKGEVEDTGSGRTELYFTDMSPNLETLILRIVGERIIPKLVGNGVHKL